MPRNSSGIDSWDTHFVMYCRDAYEKKRKKEKELRMRFYNLVCELFKCDIFILEV